MAIDYFEKLKDPRWQRKRLDIFIRDRWECQLCCNTKKTLVVHHKKYLPGCEPWDYDDNMLITLCDPCHNLLKKPSDKAPEWHDDVILLPLYENDVLQCPGCGFNYLHHNSLNWFLREREDHVTTIQQLVTYMDGDVVIDPAMEGNPSSRRDGIKIQFWCEGCDKISILCIVQHKGQTFIGWL